MKIWKHVMIYMLLAAVLLIGVFFPSLVGAVQDIQIGRMRDQVEARTVQLKMSSNLSVVQKLLVVKKGRSSAVELESAQKMEYAEAYKAAMAGLDVVLTDFIPFQKAKFSETEHSIELRMDEENSVILWNFVLEDEKHNKIQVLLDDDSGLILGFQYLLNTSVQDSETSENSGESEISGVTDAASISAYMSIVEDIEAYGVSLLEEIEIFSSNYADYLGIMTSGVSNMKKIKGSGSYVTWMFDPEEADNCELDIVVNDTEFSVNF